MTEHLAIEQFIADAITVIQQEGWKDRPMTTGEQVAVNLAVRYAIGRLKKRSVASETKRQTP